MISIQLIGTIKTPAISKLDKNQNKYLCFKIMSQYEDEHGNILGIPYQCFVFNSDKVNCKKFKRGLFVGNIIHINGSLLVDKIKGDSINIHEIYFINAPPEDIKKDSKPTIDIMDFIDK
jgi:hypothetical protein